MDVNDHKETKGHKVKCLVLLVTSCLISPAVQAVERMPISNLWKSETFRNAFTASYGVDARIEPRISPEEKAVLDSVAGKMQKANRSGSIIKLKESIWLPKSAALQFTLANLLIEEDRSRESLTYFEGAIKLHPSFRDAFRNLALAQTQMENTEEALPHLARAIELGARDGLTYGLLGWCHAAAGNHASALQAYRQAQLVMPTEWQWKLGEAYALLSLGEAAPAAKIFEGLITSQPNNTALWLAHADALMLNEEYEKAIANREVVRRMGKLSGNDLAILGHLYLSKTLADSAIQCYLDAAKANASEEQLLEGFERLLTAKHWKYARAVAETIHSVSPELQRRHDRALALMELDSGNLEAGEQAVRKMLDIDPMDAEAMLLLAQAYHKSERNEEAVMLLEQAARNPKTETEALLLLGQVFAEQGQYETSLTALERAYHLDPRPSLHDYIEAIRNLLVR